MTSELWDLDAGALTDYHDRVLNGGELGPSQAQLEVWRWIDENHRCNVALWGEEDKARRTDVPDAEIARCKRAIDRANQRRNDAAEAIDRHLLAALDRPLDPDARLSSETAGGMIDRLSILALKIHHMRIQTQRLDVDEEHLLRCRNKLAVLIEQRGDLAGCLARLLREVSAGTSRFKVYQQFKMYNDPTLNPELYGRRRHSRQSEAAQVDVLIPTCDRPGALAVTLTALFAQTCAPLRIVISDQGEETLATAAKEVQAILRLLSTRHVVELHGHKPRRGLAEQRDFLLAQARAPYVLFLDDDVVIEPDLVERMQRAMQEHGCGFVGSAVIGMSYADDERPDQQEIEFWEGRVQPEAIRPEDPQWRRHHLHSAANLYHVQTRLGLTPAQQRVYRVAWVGGCVLFDTAKLRDAGGFEFWRQLPIEHCGEDVYAQLRVMARYGGCGLIPSGAYHQELPTTVRHREVDAPRVLSLEY